MTTKQKNRVILDAYLSAREKGHRSLDDVYVTPSPEKVAIYNRLFSEMIAENGAYPAVISYNTFVFTFGYLYYRDGEEYLRVHYPTRVVEIKVSDC